MSYTPTIQNRNASAHKTIDTVDSMSLFLELSVSYTKGRGYSVTLWRKTQDNGFVTVSIMEDHKNLAVFEAKRYSEKKLRDIFDAYADVSLDNEKNIEWARENQRFCDAVGAPA